LQLPTGMTQAHDTAKKKDMKAAASSLLYFMDSLLQQQLSIFTAKEFFGCSSFHNL
jgi:hypothetical protein